MSARKVMTRTQTVTEKQTATEKPKRGWWEDYACGCVSKMVRFKKDLLGYCPTHGDSRRYIWPDEMTYTRPTQEGKK